MDKQKKQNKDTKEVKESKSTSKKKTIKEDFVEEKVPVRMFDFYKTKVIPELMSKFKYKNPFQVPKLEKICINVGAGAAMQDPKILDVIVKDVEIITGQKPIITKAKKSVSNFKLREGMKIGCKVTLRKARMYEFIEKLINITIPRIRDFRGISEKSFDHQGNYTLGIKEHVIFPEINIDKISKIFGLDVTFVTNANSDDEAYELLKAFGMPFAK